MGKTLNRFSFTLTVILMSVLLMCGQSLGKMVEEKPGNPKERKLVEEWSKVKSEYPLVAKAYLEAIELAVVGATYAISIDSKGFAQTHFAHLIANVCTPGNQIRATEALCKGIDRPREVPGGCPSCAGICSELINDPVSCIACREERANRGCF